MVSVVVYMIFTNKFLIITHLETNRPTCWRRALWDPRDAKFSVGFHLDPPRPRSPSPPWPSPCPPPPPSPSLRLMPNKSYKVKCFNLLHPMQSYLSVSSFSQSPVSFLRRSHVLCLALLTLVFTFTYSTNMILAEIFFDRLGGILPYVLVLLLIHTLRRLLTYKLTIYEDEPLKPFSSSSKSSSSKLSSWQSAWSECMALGEILPWHISPPPITTRRVSQVVLN